MHQRFAANWAAWQTFWACLEVRRGKAPDLPDFSRLVRPISEALPGSVCFLHRPMRTGELQAPYQSFRWQAAGWSKPCSRA